MKPARLRIRSAWLPEYQNQDLEIPPKGDENRKECWDIERHWGLNLLRLRWGHKSYVLKINKDDELELVSQGGNRKWT